MQFASAPAAGGAPIPPKQHQRPQPRVRVEFPETWLWSDANTGYRLIAGVIYASSEFNSRSTCFVEIINFKIEIISDCRIFQTVLLRSICPAFMNGRVQAECSVV